MFRFSGDARLVRAISDGVAEVRRLHARQGRYDGHDLINWMDDNRNAELNDIIDWYGHAPAGRRRATPGSRQVHTATALIGKFLGNKLGQVRIGEQTSQRHVTLRGGAHCNGTCDVSVWQIP